MIATLSMCAINLVDLTPLEYEQQAIEHRLRINSLHYTAVTRYCYPATDKGKEQRTASRREVWVNGDQYREDETVIEGWPSRLTAHLPFAVADGNPITRGIERRIICRGCMPDGSLLRYDAGITPVHLQRPTVDAVTSSKQNQFDPRGLGHDISISETRPATHGLLADPKVHSRTVTRVTFRGENAVLVEGVNGKGPGVRRSWIVPDKGYSVVRLESSHPPQAAEGPRKVYFEIDNEYPSDVRDGVWFPKRSRVRRYDSAGVLVYESTTEVEVADFNRPPDPSVFTLAGLKLSPGVPVMDQSGGRPKFWDGTKVVASFKGPMPAEYQPLAKAAAAAKSSPAAAPTAPTTPDPTRTPPWVYAVAAGLAAVGCGLVALARRARG